MKYILNIKGFKLMAILFAFSIFHSCDIVGGDDDAGSTATQEMAGEWYVKTYVGTSQVLGYAKISTYNTAANVASEMWLEDNGNIWEFKAKVNNNYDARTFSASNALSDYNGYIINVNVTNGQILKGAATTSGGNVSDSINFDIEFSDDPGTIYTIAGYKRTGFAEDEH